MIFNHVAGSDYSICWSSRPFGFIMDWKQFDFISYNTSNANGDILIYHVYNMIYLTVLHQLNEVCTSHKQYIQFRNNRNNKPTQSWIPLPSRTVRILSTCRWCHVRSTWKTSIVNTLNDCPAQVHGKKSGSWNEVVAIIHTLKAMNA